MVAVCPKNEYCIPTAATYSRHTRRTRPIMDRRDWRGVFPAITTPFRSDHSIDYDALARHVSWMIESGCNAIVPLGSLGEAATLTYNEKVEILRVCCDAAGDRAP